MAAKGRTPREQATYSPGGLADFRAYKARMQRLVDDGHLTDGEAHILRAIKMEGIQLDGGAGKPVREPHCHTCGRPSVVIGTMAQTYRCECSPNVEQSIADALRRK
jgi:hypothetical protein